MKGRRTCLRGASWIVGGLWFVTGAAWGTSTPSLSPTATATAAGTAGLTITWTPTDSQSATFVAGTATCTTTVSATAGLSATMTVTSTVTATSTPTCCGPAIAPSPGLYYASRNVISTSGTVTFKLVVTDPGQVTIRIYNTSGVLVRTPVDTTMPVGVFPLSWDGRSESGVAVGSGAYVVWATGPGFQNDLVVTVFH